MRPSAGGTGSGRAGRPSRSCCPTQTRPTSSLERSKARSWVDMPSVARTAGRQLWFGARGLIPIAPNAYNAAAPQFPVVEFMAKLLL